MRDHGPPGRGSMVDLGKDRGDVLVGETVKPIAPNALVRYAARQAEGLGDRRLGSVERRVETRDLWQVRRDLRHQSYRRQAMRLMEWREWYERLQLRDCARVDQ